MANGFGKLADVDLVVRVRNTFPAIAADPGAFGLDASQVEAIIELGERLDSAVQDANLALADYYSKISSKEAVRTELVRSLGFATQRIYGTETVTDVELAGVGLAPRPEFRRVRHPLPATAVTAHLIGPDTVKIQWHRGHNDSRAIYRIEVKEGNGPWRLLDVVTCTKYVHHDVVPGVQLAYRVQTQRGSNQFSAYSSVAAIWTSTTLKAA